MLLCEEGNRASWCNRRRRRRNHSRFPQRRLLVLGKATLFVLLAAATRTGIVTSGFHGSLSGLGYDSILSILTERYRIETPLVGASRGVGDADDYFLNNAVHLLEQSLAKADPPFVGKIVYGPGKGHRWMDLTLRQMLAEMQARAEAK